MSLALEIATLFAATLKAARLFSVGVSRSTEARKA
jgi:hypothetical protein